MELASIIGVTYLTEKIQKYANIKKKTDETELPTKKTEEQSCLPGKKNPSTIDLSKLTPETEKYLKDIIKKNKNLNCKTIKQIVPISRIQSSSLDTEEAGNVGTLFVDNIKKEDMKKQGTNKISKASSTVVLENQQGAINVSNTSSNMFGETNITTKSQDPVKLPQCDKDFSKLKYKKQKTCEECGAVLKDKYALKNHHISKHGSEGNKYQCDQCNYQTLQKASLEKHIITHHDNIRYPCNLCDYKATQRGSLKIHRESKHEGAQFPCEFCGKVFSLKQTQRNHTEYTHGQKRHKCDNCEYIAGQKTHLNTHKKLKHSNMLKTE